jgi:hypothetical protein
MGSVITMAGSPRRFRDARDLALMRQLPEADPAQHEPPEHRPGTAASGATRVVPHPEFVPGPPLLLDQ